MSRRSGGAEALGRFFCKEKREKLAQPSALIHLSAFSNPNRFIIFPTFFFLSFDQNLAILKIDHSWGISR